MLLVFAMKCCNCTKCLALRLITIIPACFSHLRACLTCLSVHASSLHPLLAYHHLCYVDIYGVFLFLLYATFLCDSGLVVCVHIFSFVFIFVSFHAIATILYCHLPYVFSVQFMCLIWSLFLTLIFDGVGMMKHVCVFVVLIVFNLQQNSSSSAVASWGKITALTRVKTVFISKVPVQ